MNTCVRASDVDIKPPADVSLEWFLFFCFVAVLDPRVGHTMDLLSPFIPVLRHSDWLFHGESCPRLDVVHPGRVWPFSPGCTWLCSLHYLFLQATCFPCFLMVWPWYATFLALTMSISFLFTPALLRTALISFYLFSLLSTKPAISVYALLSQMRPDVFLHSFWESSFHSRALLQATLVLSVVLSKSVCCGFSIFSAVMPLSPALCLTL